LRILSLILCLVCFHVSAKVGDRPIEQQLALGYIKALTEHDYQALRRFYNRDSVFYDKTADTKYIGTRSIIAFLQRSHEGVLEFDFNIEHMFNTGPLVVMIGNYHLRGPGEQFGKPGKIIDIAVPGVTTLKFDPNTQRLTEQVDLMDYQTMSDQLQSQ
jgi:limonene-1,2-epoxide hydrolase